MNEAKRIVTNTLAQGGGKAVSLGLSLLTTAILTRYLGTAGYGQYVFVMALVLLFSNISDWGTSIITVREAVASKERRGEIFGGLTLARFGLSLIAVVLVNVAVRLNPEWRGVVGSVSMGSLVLFFLSLKTSAGIVFQARLFLGWQAVMEIVGSGVFLGLVWLAVLVKGGLVGILAGWVAATAMAAVVGWLVVGRIEKVKWEVDREAVSRVVREAIPTGALLLLFSIYNRVDVIILQHFQGNGAVGIYGLAYKVHENLILGAAFLMNSAFPGLAERWARGEREGLRQLYKRLFGVLAGLGVVVAGGVALFSPVVVRILAGEGFMGASLPLRILMIATVFSYLNHLTGYSLIAIGKQRVSLVIAVVALVLNVGLNLWLVPVYSYMAAAVVTGVTEGTVWGLSSLAIYRALKRET